MVRQFNERNVENTRINAVKPSNENPKKVDYEICCTLSHLKAIETFLETEEQHCVICEDDLSFEFETFWDKTLDDIVQKAPNNWGIIQLAYILQNIEPKFKDKAEYFNYKTLPVSGTLAYIINRNCAKHLIEIFKKRNYIPTADCFRSGIYASVEYYTSFDSFVYKYPMFTYPDNNDSLIGNSLSLHVASKKQQMQYLKKNFL
jgi:GR25 family glycosyltransferase involved in LPS biosynthesis